MRRRPLSYSLVPYRRGLLAVEIFSEFGEQVTRRGNITYSGSSPLAPCRIVQDGRDQPLLASVS